jgi:hypothetical protein
VREDNFGIGLFSRVPFVSAEIVHLGTAGVPSGGAIAPRVGQLVQDLAGGGFGEAVQRQRGPQEVAAEMLELLAGPSG